MEKRTGIEVKNNTSVCQLQVSNQNLTEKHPQQGCITYSYGVLRSISTLLHEPNNSLEPTNVTLTTGHD